MKAKLGENVDRVYYTLYGRMLSEDSLNNAFKKVKSANGAPGIDGQSVKDFKNNVSHNIKQLLDELKSKTYNPLPVRRVEIDKEDGGVRLLGIPAVRDRVVQQCLKDILEPIFEPHFHPSSYGYRPKRGCHNAIAKATAFMRSYNMNWVVDMDLSKCFDMLDHNLVLESVAKRVKDGSVLKLIGTFLKCGVMSGDVFEHTKLGSPQGGVISPLLCNIYLDSFDQFMRSRGHRIVRYADDILIFKCSERGAENAREVASEFLHSNLKLKVNEGKTHITHLSRGVKFLGVEIFTNYIKIQDKKVVAFKKKVKAITKRNSGGNLASMILELNRLLRGFVNYYRVANCKGVLTKLMSWIRRRLRAKQMKLWKKPVKMHRRLRQLGYKGKFSYIKMSSWRNAGCQLAHMAMPNEWFEKMKLYQLDKVQVGVLPEVNR